MILLKYAKSSIIFVNIQNENTKCLLISEGKNSFVEIKIIKCFS